MVSVAVRPLLRTTRLSSLLLLACAACGRLGFDSKTLDGGVIVAVPDAGIDAGGANGGSTAGTNGGATNGDGANGGTSTGGETDAGDDAGEPRDPCNQLSDFVVCEAFEDDDLNGNVEKKVSDGDLSITDGALVASIDHGGAKAALRWTFDKQKEGSLYLRVALSVPESVSIEALSVSTLASDEKDTDIAFKLLSNDRLQVSIQEIAREQAGVYNGLRGVPMCLTARIDIDENAGDVKAAIDKAQGVNAADVDTLPGKGISELKVGIGASAADQAAISVRIHDVLLTTSESGPCP